MYEYTLTTRFNDIDYAERVYYVNAFEYVHEAEEHWFEDLGFSMRTQKEDLGIQFPVVDAHAEYFKPMGLEEELTIELSIPSISEKVFTVNADVSRVGEDVFNVELVRVCMDVESQRSTPIPDAVRDAFKPYIG